MKNLIQAVSSHSKICARISDGVSTRFSADTGTFTVSMGAAKSLYLGPFKKPITLSLVVGKIKSTLLSEKRQKPTTAEKLTIFAGFKVKIEALDDTILNYRFV